MKLGPFVRTRSRSRIIVTLCVAVGLALILGLPVPSHQKIQGKTQKQWAELLIVHPTQITNAPSSIRLALVPYLIDEIHANSFPRDLRFKLSSWLYDFAPELFLAWVPEPIPINERQLNAVILLGEMGPLAHEAVPALILVLDAEALQCSAIFTLQAIGPAARMAVPKMIQLLIDDPEPRLATALAILAPDDPDVIRALAEASRTGPGNVRLEAAEALKICAAKLTSSLALLKDEAAGIDTRRTGSE